MGLFHCLLVPPSSPCLPGMALSPAGSLSLPSYWLPRWLSGKESTCQCRRYGFNPWLRKIPWRRKWQPTPIFLPWESHGQGGLVGYSLWGCKESDTTEVTEHTRMHQGGSGYCFREVNSVVKGSQKTVIYASCSPNIRVQGPSSESFLSHS